MKQRTDAEYIDRPNHCPFCDTDQLEGDGVEIDGRNAYQEIRCLKCDKSWTDYYVLIGYNETS